MTQLALDLPKNIFSALRLPPAECSRSDPLSPTLPRPGGREQENQWLVLPKPAQPAGGAERLRPGWLQRPSH